MGAPYRFRSFQLLIHVLNLSSSECSKGFREVFYASTKFSNVFDKFIIPKHNTMYNQVLFHLFQSLVYWLSSLVGFQVFHKLSYYFTRSGNHTVSILELIFLRVMKRHFIDHTCDSKQHKIIQSMNPVTYDSKAHPTEHLSFLAEMTSSDRWHTLLTAPHKELLTLLSADM